MILSINNSNYLSCPRYTCFELQNAQAVANCCMWQCHCNACESVVLFDFSCSHSFLFPSFLFPSAFPAIPANCSSLYITSWKWKLEGGGPVGGRKSIPHLTPTPLSRGPQRCLPSPAIVSSRAPLPGWPVDEWRVGCTGWTDAAG